MTSENNLFYEEELAAQKRAAKLLAAKTDEQIHYRALVRRFDAMAYDMQRMSENDMGLLSEDFADRFISITDAMLKLAARLKEDNQ